jgi:Retrotransposon gag protein
MAVQGIQFDLNNFIVTIPEYSGVENEASFRRFLDIAGGVYGRLNGEGRTQFMANISCKLYGGAYELFSRREYVVWETLRADLIERFEERNSMGQLQTQLVNCCQDKSESIRDFANRVEYLLSELVRNSRRIVINNVNAEAHFRLFFEAVAIRAFCDGVRSKSLSILLKARNFDTLRAVIQLAINEEMYRNSDNCNRNFGNRNKHSNNNSREFNENPNEQQHEVYLVNNFRERRRCFECKRIGHIRKNCFRRKNNVFRKKKHIPKRCYTNTVRKNVEHGIYPVRMSENMQVYTKSPIFWRGCSMKIDTGSSLTFLKVGLTKHGIRINDSERTQLHGLASSKLETLGTVTAPIEMGRRTIEQKFHLIADDACAPEVDGVLGRDFLLANRIRLDLATGELKFDEPRYKVNSLQRYGRRNFRNPHNVSYNRDSRQNNHTYQKFGKRHDRNRPESVRPLPMGVKQINQQGDLEVDLDLAYEAGVYREEVRTALENAEATANTVAVDDMETEGNEEEFYIGEEVLLAVIEPDGMGFKMRWTGPHEVRGIVSDKITEVRVNGLCGQYSNNFLKSN